MIYKVRIEYDRRLRASRKKKYNAELNKQTEKLETLKQLLLDTEINGVNLCNKGGVEYMVEEAEKELSHCMQKHKNYLLFSGGVITLLGFLVTIILSVENTEVEALKIYVSVIILGITQLAIYFIPLWTQINSTKRLSRNLRALIQFKMLEKEHQTEKLNNQKLEELC